MSKLTEQMDFYRTIGRRLERRRKVRGFTLKAAGAEVGLTHQALSAIETARHRATLYDVCRYARFLGMDLHEVFAARFSDVDPPDVTVR